MSGFLDVQICIYVQMHTEYNEECRAVYDYEVLYSGVLLLRALDVSQTCCTYVKVEQHGRDTHRKLQGAAHATW